MDFDKSSIERLKRTLYSRDESVAPKEKRTPVQQREELLVPKTFGGSESFDLSLEVGTRRKHNSFFNKFLLGSVVFFLVSFAVAIFIFFGGFNTISSNNVDITVIAPSSISSGERFLAEISVVNRNPADIMETTLFIDYPNGVRMTDNPDNPLIRGKTALDVITSGHSKNYSISALLFGQKDAVKTFTLRLEYKVKGSNAVFSKQKTFDVLIGVSPLSLNVRYPESVNSGGQVMLSIDLSSNSSVLLKKNLLKIDFPYGFTYTDSNIKPLRDNAVWSMGDLKPGDKKTLTVYGTLVGQDLEDRSFRITSGTQNSLSVPDFDTDLATFVATVGIRKSFFDLSLSSSKNGVTPAGQNIPIYISWKNTLPDKIINTRIETTISGSLFDRTSVIASNGGFYRSSDNTIVWDKSTSEDLSSITPGDGGQVYFSLASFPNISVTNGNKNPHIDAHVIITGDRYGAETGEVSSSADITIKISSTLGLSAKSYRSYGSLLNTGLVPPKADKESTYTLVWTLTNTVNDLKDVIVKATLPIGVVWKEETEPSFEKITYNPDTREVSWAVSAVSSGVGFINSAREVRFKVGITPSITQVGIVPTLLSQTTAGATDMYTDAKINVTASPVSTFFSDSSFRQGQDIVVK